MRLLRQYWALLTMNLAGAPARAGLVSTLIIGVACAVGVLVSMLAMGVGARQEAMGNVRPERVILRSQGATGVADSRITKDLALQLRDLPGIRRDAKGAPIAVSEAFVFIQARDKRSGSRLGFPMRGITGELTAYLPELHLTSGRMFKTGLRELIASNRCAERFSDFKVGDRRIMRGGEWPIVGRFDLGGTLGNCVVFGDGEAILAAFGRDAFNQVDVMLQRENDFEGLVKAIKANPLMKVDARHEAQIVADSSRQLIGILDFVSYFVGTIMALAATMGAVNSLYAMVDQRRRDIATLRALGFNGLPIIASVLTESMLLALPGAVLGALVAWALFNGTAASPLGASFHLQVTPALGALGLTWALVIGLISGFLPAIRAARVPVTVALRAV